jgi:hypothetical protein
VGRCEVCISEFETNWTDGPVPNANHEGTGKRRIEKVICAVTQQTLVPLFTVTAVDGEDAFKGIDTITGEQGELSVSFLEIYCSLRMEVPVSLGY